MWPSPCLVYGIMYHVCLCKDLIEKLCSAELEVEKVAMMTTGLDQSAISEDDVKTAEGWVNLCAENSWLIRLM